MEKSNGNFNIKTYIVQIYNKDERTDNLVESLRYFMFEDKKNPIYLHVYENTLFIYSAYDFWNMNSLSMMIRSHLKGNYFIIYEIDEYDGLLPSVVWEKKKDAKKYFNDKHSVLNKYKRKYTLDKVTKNTFKTTESNDKPTAESFYNNVVEENIESDE